MKKSIKRGFTMIELLIVIAVLAVLAIATISALNPIEQIRRSQDTGSRSDAETLIGAVDRYYTSRGYFPWQLSANDTSVNVVTTTLTNAKVVTDGTTTMMTKLGDSAAGTAELKGAFVTRIAATGYNPLLVFNNGAPGASTYVCFQSRSKSFQGDALSRCTPVAPDVLPGDWPVGACGGTAATSVTCLP